MGWKLTGTSGLADADVDVTFKALRVTIRPMEVTSWVSLGLRSGAITGIAAAGALFSLRQLAATQLIMRRLGVGFFVSTAFTTAQEVAFGVSFCRAFTASDSAGTAVAITGSNGKARTSLGTFTSVDCRIAAAAALTAGTKTVDANSLAVVSGIGSAAIGVGVPTAPNNLISHDAGDYPIVMAQNEGVNITNLVAMGAGGIGVLSVNMEVAEATTY